MKVLMWTILLASVFAGGIIIGSEVAYNRCIQYNQEKEAKTFLSRAAVLASKENLDPSDLMRLKQMGLIGK